MKTFNKNKKKTSSFTKIFILLFAIIFITIISCITFAMAPAAPKVLDQIEELEFEAEMEKIFPQKAAILKSLPYRLSDSSTKNLDIWAHSAIIADVNTGNILYEKNADLAIPPASMTKLFVMAVTEFEISAGNINLNDRIHPAWQSLEQNLPADSSLMHLRAGQTPTLHDLLMGLSVNSGNDAAIAIAYALCGGIEPFVQRMNALAQEIGLEHTHFEEPSGYSEHNITTARDFCKFCIWYIKNFEPSLKEFHAQKDFTWSEITKENTNPLLPILEGCDGLKTGYIEESGFNLALTAIRNGHRFLSITMGGPGNSTAEGQKGRIHDGTALMEWAFANFRVHNDQNKDFRRAIKVYGSKQRSVYAVPAYSGTFSVPANLKVEETVSLPETVYFDDIAVATGLEPSKDVSIPAGTKLGCINYISEAGTMQEIPLVTERALNKNNALMHITDRIIWHFAR